MAGRVKTPIGAALAIDSCAPERLREYAYTPWLNTVEYFVAELPAHRTEIAGRAGLFLGGESGPGSTSEASRVLVEARM